MRAACLLAPLALAGCVMVSSDRPTSLSSEPPGASVHVDGRDSGYATPCLLDLGTAERLRIDFVLEGFVTETRVLEPDGAVYAILWREMYTSDRTWNSYLFLNLNDIFVPVKRTNLLSPSRLHVELLRTSDLTDRPPEETPPATLSATGAGPGSGAR